MVTKDQYVYLDMTSKNFDLENNYNQGDEEYYIEYRFFTDTSSIIFPILF